MHIIFAGDLGGRSLEAVTSQDAAVRGHRLFAVDDLDGVVLHPPIQRFVSRWRPGDPAVYSVPLGTLIHYAPRPPREFRRARARHCVSLRLELVGGARSSCGGVVSPSASGASA